jgi:soluble lytic murein transglycosylase
MLALMRQESTFNPGATSSADARGLTQVVPATGELLAQQLGYQQFDADDLYRPIVSIQFGATFLNETLGRYGGRVYPALAAYNAGPGASDDWLTTYGDDMDVWAERIPYPETYGYVQKVFTFYGRYRLVYGLAQP